MQLWILTELYEPIGSVFNHLPTTQEILERTYGFTEEDIPELFEQSRKDHYHKQYMIKEIEFTNGRFDF